MKPQRKTWECGCISYHCPRKGMRMVERCIQHELKEPRSTTAELMEEMHEIIKQHNMKMAADLFKANPFLDILKGQHW